MSFGEAEQKNSRPGTSQKVKDVLGSGQGVFDLRTPPSRAEAGMVDGPDLVSFQDRGHEVFRVQVLLPEDEVLEVETDLVTFHTDTAIRPNTDPPTTMDIHRGSLAPADARDVLLAAAAQFGLETEPIRQWYEIAESGVIPAVEAVAKTPYLNGRVGYLSVTVQGRYSPLTDSAAVHFIVFWNADGRMPEPERDLKVSPYPNPTLRP